MKIFRNIFGFIWAIWALITFVSSLLIIIIPSMLTYLVKDPRGQDYFIRLSRLWMNIWLFLVGCPVTIRGREHFKKGETYVVVFNHNALLDVPLSAPYVPGPNKTIAEASFAKIPIFGWFYSKGSVLVDRKNEKSRSRSFEAMQQVLASGMHMCIYPEGTRNRTGKPLKPFYDGAFKLALASQKQIIPCVIKGTTDAMPIHKKFYLFPTRLSMQFLPPVSSTNVSVEELKEKVYNSMLEEYTRNP